MDIILWTLTLLTLLTGPFWFYEHLIYARKRFIQGATPWGIERLAPLFPWLAIALLLKLLVFELYMVPSESMSPTLKKGDVIAISLINLRVSQLQKALGIKKGVANDWISSGDIIIFKAPSLKGQILVKRVAAIPGNTVIPDEAGGVKVIQSGSGSKLANDRAEHCGPEGKEILQGCPASTGARASLDKSADDGALRAQSNASEVKNSAEKACERDKPVGSSCVVPGASYFTLGDNARDSVDSRFFGPVRFDSVRGRVFLLISWDQGLKFF